MEAELRSSPGQIKRNPFCERVCDSEHAPRNPFHILERRHALVEIVECGARVPVEHLRIITPHFEREPMSFSENASRHAKPFAKERSGFVEALSINKGRRIVVGRPEGSLIFLAMELQASRVCDSDGWTVIGPHWHDWRRRTVISKPAAFGPVDEGTRWRFARDPSLSASELRLERSSGDASLGLHWINGLCARGPHFPKKYRRMCLRKERMTRRHDGVDNVHGVRRHS